LIAGNTFRPFPKAEISLRDLPGAFSLPPVFLASGPRKEISALHAKDFTQQTAQDAGFGTFQTKNHLRGASCWVLE
jgi:hypothetical protein